MSSDVGSSVSDKVRMFEQSSRTTSVSGSEPSSRTSPFNRSPIARRYADAKSRSSPRTTNGVVSPRAVLIASRRKEFASAWERRVDETDTSGRTNTVSVARDMPATKTDVKDSMTPVSPGRRATRGGHFDKIYASKFQATKKTVVEHNWESKETHRPVVANLDKFLNAYAESVEGSTEEESSSQDENKKPLADLLQPTSPLSTRHSAKSDGPPLSPKSPASSKGSSRADRLRLARVNSPILVGRGINIELKRNLNAASATVQEEKASSVNSGSSRSSRSSLSNEELTNVAKRALQLSKVAAETRTSRIENSPLTQMLKYKRARKITVEGTPATATNLYHEGYGPEVKSLGSSTITSYDGSKTSRDTDSKTSQKMSRADRIAALKRHNQKSSSILGDAASVGSMASMQAKGESSHPVFGYSRSPVPPRHQKVFNIHEAQTQDASPLFSTRYARAAALGSGHHRGSSPDATQRDRVDAPGPVARTVARPLPVLSRQRITVPPSPDSPSQKFGGYRSEALNSYRNILEASRGKGSVSEKLSTSPSSRPASDCGIGDASTATSDPFSQLSGGTGQARLSRAQRAKQLKASIDKSKFPNTIQEDAEYNSSFVNAEHNPAFVGVERQPNPYFRPTRFSEDRLNDSLKFLVARADAQIENSRLQADCYNGKSGRNKRTSNFSLDLDATDQTDSNSRSSQSRDSWAQYDEEDLFQESATEDKTISPVASDDIVFEDNAIESVEDAFKFNLLSQENDSPKKKPEEKFTANFSSVGFDSYSFPSDGDSAKKELNVEESAPERHGSDVEQSILMGENISTGESLSRSAASVPRPRTLSTDGSKSATSFLSSKVISPSNNGVKLGAKALDASSTNDGNKPVSVRSARIRSASLESFGKTSTGESVSRVEPIPEDEPLDSSVLTQEETLSNPDGHFMLKEKMSTNGSTSSESHNAKPDALRWWQRNYGKKVSVVTNSVVRGAFSRKARGKKAISENDDGNYEQAKVLNDQIILLEEDEDEDVFSGLEEESRLPEKSIENSDNEAERPSASSDESGIPVPASLMMKDPRFEKMLKKSEEIKAKLTLVPPPPPPPVPPRENLRAPTQRESPRRSGMMIEESEAIDRVTSDITSSVLGVKSRKASGYTQDRVQTIKEEPGEDDREAHQHSAASGRMVPDSAVAACSIDDENSVVASVNVSISGDSNEKAAPPLYPGSIFMSLACGLGEQLNQVCRAAQDKTLGFYKDPNSKIENGSCFDSHKIGSGRACEAPLDSCTPKDVADIHDATHTMASSARRTGGANSHITLNEDEQQIWNQWDFRDDHSVNEDGHPTGLFPADDETMTTAKRKEHEARREQAHQRLLDHVKKAQARNRSVVRSAKELEPLRIFPASPGAGMFSPTPKSIATEFSFQQLNVLASFSSTLKNKGIEILKVNRRNQWQLRFLTVSNDDNGGKFAGVAAIERCPKALLWLKTFNPRKHSLSSIKLRHGGLLFKNVIKVETLWRLPKERPIPKKLKIKFPDFAGVVIDYKCEGGDRNVTLCFKSRADARSFCTAVMVIKEVVLRQEDFASDESE